MEFEGFNSGIDFVAELDRAFPVWRFFPPVGSRIFNRDGKQAIPANQPAGVTFPMCEVDAKQGQILVVQRWGCEIIEWVRDDLNRVYGVPVPPAAAFEKAFWNIRYHTLGAPIDVKAQQEGQVIVDGWRQFSTYSMFNGATPIVLRGPVRFELFLRIINLALGAWQIPLDGLQITANLAGFVVDTPQFNLLPKEQGRPAF